jgi:hypothetical protein
LGDQQSEEKEKTAEWSRNLGQLAYGRLAPRNSGAIRTGENKRAAERVECKEEKLDPREKRR